MKYQILTQRPKYNERCIVCHEDAVTHSAVLLKGLVVKSDGTRKFEETVWKSAHERCVGGELKNKNYGLKWTGPDTWEVKDEESVGLEVRTTPTPSPVDQMSQLAITEDLLRRIVREELERALSAKPTKKKR